MLGISYSLSFPRFRNSPASPLLSTGFRLHSGWPPQNPRQLRQTLRRFPRAAASGCPPAATRDLLHLIRLPEHSLAPMPGPPRTSLAPAQPRSVLPRAPDPASPARTPPPASTV